MKNKLSRFGRILIPIFLCAALVSTAFLSIDCIDALHGNARVINYVGIVRGATQRLIKKELNHVADDKLIERLDKILFGLSNGSSEFNLIKLDCQEFQQLLLEMENDWTDIKEEIYRYRGGSSNHNLYEMSESYFELADQTVYTAETFTEQIVQNARNLLIIMNTVFVVLAGGCTLLTFYQEKRRDRLIEIERENKRKSEQLSKRLQELLVPMNEISELMYVADMDTYELLFVNEAGKKMFHVSDDISDLKCFKVLQGFDSPCSFCTNPFLKADETYSWEYTNPIIKKHYLLKDRLIDWEGRLARMEIAFDITEADNEKNELKKRLESDNILVECIRELYHNHDIYEAITTVLRQIGTLFSAERAYILLFHEDHFSNIAEWCKDGIIPQMEHLQMVPLTDYRVWVDALERQDNVVLNDIEELRESLPSGYELLSKQGINNIIWVPLERDAKLSGCIGLDNQEFSMSKTAIPFLQTVQYFITLAMQRNENEKMLFELSYLDRLTSFYNRNCYIQDIADLENSHDSVGVVYLDVNGLKDVNDSLGHDAGDQLLKTCAEVIRESTDSDRLYRIGGDEFVIICTDISEEEFCDGVQTLKNKFEHSKCQIAIGSKWEKDSKNIQEIIKQSDELMYADKKRFYQGHHAANRYRHNNELLRFLADPYVLKENVSNHNFKIYLQAKVNVETCEVVGAEALVRYQDRDGLIHSPDKFIPVLEDSHFISKVDYYVFEEVCRNLQTWSSQGMSLFTVSSNFSRSTFMDDYFVNKIESISDQYNIPRTLLEIEITEGADYADFDILKNRINEVREAGFRVSIDDFGVECSNLALLSITEFDVLKIDKGFVKDITYNNNAQLIVEMMAETCKRMNIQLVAEGVETNEQLEVLKARGVKVVQGFLFSRPEPISHYGKKEA